MILNFYPCIPLWMGHIHFNNILRKIVLLGWQPHQIVRVDQHSLHHQHSGMTYLHECPNSMYNARARSWVQANGVNGLGQMIVMLGLCAHWASLWATKAQCSRKPPSLLKCFGCQRIYVLSFMMWSTQLISLPSLHVLLKFCLVTMIW